MPNQQINEQKNYRKDKQKFEKSSHKKIDL